jgi:hypothetical protein
MPTAPGMPGAAPSDPGHGGEGAGDGCAGIMPAPGGPGGGSRAIVRCRARYRIPPGPGRGHQLGHGARTSGGCRTAPGSGSEASGRRPRARRQATMTSMRPPRTRGGGRQPALPAGQQPARGALATGHGATPRVGPRAARTATGPAAPRAQTPDVAGPLRRRCPRLPTVSRLIGPERQVVPSRHRRRSRSPFSCR